MAWRPAKSLLTLRDQVDAKWPGRDKSSDGIIGDASHQATQSDHNPDAEGIVRAMDISNDPAHGLVSRELAETLLASRNRRIRYLISNAQIVFGPEAAEANGATAWVWKAYHGANPHTGHMHISVSRDDALADDTSPWPIDGAQPAPQLVDTGGAWQSGKGSVYSWFTGKYVWEDPGDKRNSNVLGVSDEYQGISFLDISKLGQWFEVEAPNLARSIEQQTEKGPATWTGRLIDISAVAAERFGYSPKNFPTDGIFRWRPAPVPGGLEGLPPKDQAEQWYRIRSDPNVPLPRPPVPAPPPVPPPPSASTNTETRLRALEAASANTAAAMERLNQVVADISARKEPTMTDPSPQHAQSEIDWGPLLAEVRKAFIPLLKELLPLILAAAVPYLKGLAMQWLTGRASAAVAPATAFALPQGTVTGALGLIGAIVSALAPILTKGAVPAEAAATAATISLGVAGAGGVQATRNVMTKPKA